MLVKMCSNTCIINQDVKYIEVNSISKIISAISCNQGQMNDGPIAKNVL